MDQKSKKIVLAAIVAIGVAVVSVLFWRSLRTPEPAGVLVASGRIEARLTSLTARSTGRVMQINADEGRPVKTGQILAVIDDEALRARVRSLEARVRRTQVNLEQARRDVKRAEVMAEGNFMSPQAVELARLKVQEQEATLHEAKATLGEQRALLVEQVVHSPIDSTVLTRTIEVGELVNPGTPLFTLVDLNSLYVKIYVPEPQIGKIALDQEARIYVDSYPGRFFPARVSKVASQAEFTPKNVETREERVKLVFAVELVLAENPGGVLKPGMPADAVVRLDQGAAWIAPTGGRKRLFSNKRD